MRRLSEITEDTVRSTFEAPRELIEGVREMAKAHDRTVSAEIRVVISEAIDRFRRDQA